MAPSVTLEGDSSICLRLKTGQHKAAAVKILKKYVLLIIVYNISIHNFVLNFFKSVKILNPKKTLNVSLVYCIKIKLIFGRFGRFIGRRNITDTTLGINCGNCFFPQFEQC